MKYPAYIDTVAPLSLRDPLAGLLATFDEGAMTISYLEVVKSAGHSCPVVAGAWLMTAAALAALYGADTPVRGDIVVSFKEAPAAGVAGVIGNVVSHITGATATSGFKGLGGRFVRHGLMNFNAEIGAASARFQRRDTAAQVDVTYNPGVVPGDPRHQQLKPKIMQGTATADEQRRFGELAQEHVARIFAARDQVITLTDITAAST